MNRKFVVLISVLGLIGAALAQTQQRSIRADVQQLKEFVSWKVVGPVTPNATFKLERSQEYAVTLRVAEGQTPTVRLLLGTGKKPYIHFAGIIFTGQANRAAGVAHGYLTGMMAERCLGLDSPALSKVKVMTRDVVNRLRGPRVADTVDIGTIHTEASAELKDGQATIVVTMDRRDAPGQNGWKSYCGLEPG